MEIIDNYLEEPIFKSIENLLMGYDFPWYYNDFVANKKDLTDYFYLHYLFDEGNQKSGYFNDIASPILGRLRFNKILRAQVNCFQKKPEIVEHAFHTDREEPHKVALFYVNTNDGYTLFKNGKKVESVANRVIIFDGSLEHKSSAQTNTNIRVNVNINFQ